LHAFRITLDMTACIHLKETTMKRIAKTLLVISLASATFGVFAASSASPSSAEETTSLWSEFPNMRTYADTRPGNAAAQPAMRYPSGGVEQMPQSAEFSNLRSYAALHRNDNPVAASTPAFPSSAEETTSMAEEGLVPGVNGGASANAYAGFASPVHN
jgi:hypothetical protein